MNKADNFDKPIGTIIYSTSS